MSAPVRLSWTDVRDQMRARILARSYDLGARLPRDEDIAAELGCTRTTVHRAMQELEKAGLIERRRKGGTHVRAQPITRSVLDIPVTRHEVEGSGAAYSYRLLSREVMLCPHDIAARFGLKGPHKMLHLLALHLADGAPYVLEDRWIDVDSNPDVLAEDFTLLSANEWLVRHKPYSRVQIDLTATGADADIARVMQCAQGAALLVNTRTTWAETAPITTVQAIAAPGGRLTARSAD